MGVYKNTLNPRGAEYENCQLLIILYMFYIFHNIRKPYVFYERTGPHPQFRIAMVPVPAY